ncbi:Bacillibactin exporter [Lentibacillus sp. JNUCC-1]|uniref:MFS transporter n=1 Tax=Lentibacillus sp. JNUCC-1 TaxID=2654513 RepID=UPI0012E707F2|nr:MFS transporter [Lentibacillus sp. JNUCC-1]MUV36639.1 Bacillibactin exporter [Lentibacillus sp. JNUCC-1]
MTHTNQSGVDQDKRRWAIISLASIPLIMTLGNSMLIPILPLMEKELGITALQSSYIITAYSIVAIILIPIAGFLSDRYGRKVIIVPALIITGIGGLVAGVASWKMDDPFMVILLGRILQGVGSSGAAPIVLPLVGDMFQRDEDASSTMGIIETSNTAGKVLSPILGSLLALVVWFLPFLSIPVFSLISVLLVIFLIKASDDQGEEEEPFTFKKYLQLIKDVFAEHARWLVAVFIIGAILMFILFGFLFYLSSVLEDQYGYTGVWKGLMLAVPLLALAVASYISGKKIKDDLKVMKWITFIGIILAGSAVVLIPLKASPVYLLAIFFVCGTGIGMSLPALDALITKSLEKDVRGIVTSIYSAMRFIGVAAGPPVIAFLMTKEIAWIAGLLAVFALGAGWLAYRNIKP